MNEVTTKKPKLFALLVGINDYDESFLLAGEKIKFPKLRGCLSDVRKIKEYLLTVSDFEPFIQCITDQEATKKRIVRLFSDHLGKAGENDVAFFYYSGHGTQEFADKSLFLSETDGRLEDIVCYYDKNNKEDFLLADKELRWLIHHVALKKPHIVTIFDCCHSGDNTRNAQLLKNSFAEVTEKRVPFVFPVREWHQFIFSNDITKENMVKSGEMIMLPESKHVQFAACESDESAVEIAGEAVFTNVLLQVLNKAGGEITYYSLNSRVRQYMRHVYEQKPKLYVAGEPVEIFRNFLNKPDTTAKRIFGEMVFNETDSWMLNLGAIHGIGNNTPALKIFDPSDPSKIFSGKIGTINIDTTELIPDGNPDQTKVYKVYMEGIAASSVKVHIAPNGAGLNQQSELLKELSSKSKILLSDKEEEAQYVLRLLNNRYYLTHPFDIYRPLVVPVSADENNIPAKIISDLEHAATWESIKNLSNQDPATRISMDALKIEISIGQFPENFRVIEDKDQVEIDYFLKEGKWTNNISIRLTNTTKKNLYCCVVYLMSNFASYARFLHPSVKMLIPGESAFLQYQGDPVIQVGFSDIVKWYNWKENKDYFKFIISTENFDATLLDFEGLDSPDLPVLHRHLDNDHRSDIEAPAVDRGWFTKQVALVLKNPQYNIISEEELSAMLNDPKTADFALGIYFYVNDDLFNPSHELKAEIQVTEHLTKGFISQKIVDIANWWSRKKRNQFYDTAVKKYPTRIRIVSEGDSWFQHPLVFDIIDHLQRVYNIYCVGAAGDTLRNYLSGEKANGEYFMDALQDKNPEFFLLSGGGNDILGSRFSNFLAEDPAHNNPEGESRLFLKQEFFDELESLMNIYNTTFAHLKIHEPELQIIVHGYDYPVKLNDAHKGWLGKYMIEKGISNPAGRQKLIHFIMDCFNVHISKLAEQYDNVTYIDLRNTVRFNEKDGADQWYDEIHPNSEGFQQISMKFIRVIDGIFDKKKKKYTANNFHNS